MRFAVTVTLNIGLNVPDGEYMDPTDTMQKALEALGEHLNIKRYRGRIALEGGTEVPTWSVVWEDTLVVEVQGTSTARRGGVDIMDSVYKLSEALNQDCIAFRGVVAFDDAEYGPFRAHVSLVGPKAEEWGEFDPKRFITYDGWQE